MAQPSKNTEPRSTPSASSQNNQSSSKNDAKDSADTRSKLKSEASNVTGKESSKRDYGVDTPSNTSEASPPNPIQTLDDILAELGEVAHDVHCYMVKGITCGGIEISLCFLRAPLDPPITTASLTELDMTRIINNPRLRYDVNFDRDLHFRPNTEGPKSKEKMAQADLYWKALQGELFMYGFLQERLTDPEESANVSYWMSVRAHCEQRLPKAFDAIRDVLKSLVPDYDQQTVSDRLESNFIMTQIKNGTCDLVDLASWLGKLLKSHCAPMRDQMVDRMCAEIAKGARLGHVATLVNGIRQLTCVLEAMKLDVANHQLRHMRPLLIQDTITFERKYNAYRISLGKVDVVKSGLWFDREMAVTASQDPLKALPTALLRSILFDMNKDFFPSTFWLDAERLAKLRKEMHTAIYQELCRGVLTEVAHSNSNPPSKSKLAQALADLDFAITAILGGSGELAIEDHIENIALEIVRLVHTMEGRGALSDPSLVAFVERRLEDELHMTSIEFEKHAQELTDRILPRILAGVKKNISFPTLHLQHRLLPPAPLPIVHHFGIGAVCAPPPIVQPPDAEEIFVRKLIHILILHWQVFGELVYLAGEVVEGGSPASPTATRTPPSPTSPISPMPIATAVYAPGRKWLPIGVTTQDAPTTDLPARCKPNNSRSRSSSHSSSDEDDDPRSTISPSKNHNPEDEKQQPDEQ